MTPGTYDIKASAKSFQAKAGNRHRIKAPATQKRFPPRSDRGCRIASTVTVSADSEMIPVDNGAHTDVLTACRILTTCTSRSKAATQLKLLKVLPGTATMSGPPTP